MQLRVEIFGSLSLSFGIVDLWDDSVASCFLVSWMPPWFATPISIFEEVEVLRPSVVSWESNTQPSCDLASIGLVRQFKDIVVPIDRIVSCLHYNITACLDNS